MRTGFPILLLVSAWSLAGARISQSQRLSAPLAPEMWGGSAGRPKVTLDGSHVVYLANRAAPGTYELFGVPFDGSGPSLRLNAALLAGQTLGLDWELGAGERVVYTVESGLGSNYSGALFSVRADGSAAPVPLTPPGVQVYGFLVEGENPRVAANTSGGIYLVPIDGSAPAVALPNTLGAAPIAFTPDDTHTLIASAGASVVRIHSVVNSGLEAPVQLAEHFLTPPFHEVFLYIGGLSAGGSHLLYEVEDYANFFPAGTFSLVRQYSVRLGGSLPPVQLTQTNPNSRVVFDASVPGGKLAFVDGTELIACTTDGSQRVVLNPAGTQARLPLAVDGTTAVFCAQGANGQRAVYRAPLDGSQPAVALTVPLPVDFDALAVANHATVVAVLDHGARSLIALPLAGGAPLVLEASAIPGHGARDFLLTADGQRALYQSDASATGEFELRCVRLDGSTAPVALAPVFAPPNASPGFYQLHPSGTDALFLSDQRVDTVRELFRVPLDASHAPLQLNELVPTGQLAGDVREVRVTADGTRAVYRLDPGAGQQAELQVVALAQPGLALELSGSDDVLDGFLLTPSSEHVVYRTDHAFPELRLAPLDGSASPRTLAAPAFLPLLTPDGTSVVYAGSGDLRRVALDGLTPPLVLHTLSQGTVLDPVLDAQGTRAVFLASGPSPLLYQVPLDGSAPATQLNQTLVPGGRVWSFQITADGAHVVYRADAVTSGKIELYVVPADGSRAPRRLSPTLGTFGDVTDFALSADGQRVVLRANASGDGTFDLFGAPIGRRFRRAGLPPAHASGPGPGPVNLTRLPAGRQVAPDFVLTPDGASVLLRADRDQVGRVELYRVASGGSGDPVRLNPALVPGGSVSSFTLRSDGAQLVYLVSALNAPPELFAVPVAGGASTGLATLSLFSQVDGLTLDASSGLVHYRSDVLVNDLSELYSVPLDGSAPPLRRNGNLAAGGDVLPGILSLDDGRLVYRADELVDESVELFLAP